jgi:4'-phosphopantetheinyl transferase
VQGLLPILDANEVKRAEHFHFQEDRTHFIVARSLLRIILSRYLFIKPSQIHFRYSPYGKPSLDAAYHRANLCFNLSHSCGLALYAITCGREVGIDLEYIREDFPCEEVAERFFSPYEKAMIRRLPAGMKYQAFFNCWTRKEAYMKARGEGLSFPLDQFDVSLLPYEPAALLKTYGDPQQASRWSMKELSPDPYYAAALVAEGHGWHLEQWQLPATNLEASLGEQQG